MIYYYLSQTLFVMFCLCFNVLNQFPDVLLHWHTYLIVSY